MKKILLTFLIMVMAVSASSGLCFAGDGDGTQSYAEEQVLSAKPIVTDQEYPQWGFLAHSWISGVGSETIAHTQLIDTVTGKVIKEIDKKCNYAEPVNYGG